MFDFDTIHSGKNRCSEKWEDAFNKGCPEDITPLTVADMEFATAPEIISDVAKTAESGLWGYTGADTDFKEIVVGWMNRKQGWKSEKQSIVCTSGVIHTLFAAVRAFTSPGDNIIIQPPVYAPFSSAIKMNGRNIIENKLILKEGNYQMDFEDLSAKAPNAKMMILCNPHNPIGRVWSEKELENVAEICHENNIILFSDEIHGDIIMPGHQFTSMGKLADKYRDNIIIGTSASKTFSLAGLGCSSTFVFNESYQKRLVKQLKIDGPGFNSIFGTVATKAAYQKGEPWLEELIQYLNQNKIVLNNFISKEIPNIGMSSLEGTYLVWLDVSSLGLEKEELDLFLMNKAKLYVTNGTVFGKGGEGFIRINIACPQKVLMNSLQRLNNAIKQL